MMQAVSTAYEEAFRAHEQFLWGLCYRMTGCAADADDLVQDTFVRALERPPARTEEPWRPWLVKVAMNLGRDFLRRRRRRRYVGPWLPGPIETAEESPPAFEPSVAGRSTEARYELIESCSFAFLLALEALSPAQRAVLLLRDVFDYSVIETAAALDMTAANVKTTHHRARRAMAGYDRERCPSTRTVQERTRAALTEFLSGLIEQDVAKVERLLAADVRALSDGAGEVFAARVPIVGRARVRRFYLNIARRRGASVQADFRLINGLPALVAEFTDVRPGEPRRMVMTAEVNATGQIQQLYAVLASRKLAGISPAGTGRAADQ